ncbi:MAG: CopG family transcriptional regulator [Bdellovibrio sp.]|nr:MAG: CopG family transcriptional regulator [Bdellovibrio sp.]
MRSNKAQIVSISLPPDMTKEVQELAREERRSVSEVLREAFRQYAANKILKDVRKEARRTIKKKGIKPEDVEHIVREGRK